MVTLIVQTSDGNPAANTYQDVATVRDYATQRGKVLPADNDKVAAALVRAADYVEMFQYIGDLPTGARLSFPRRGIGSPADALFLPPEVVQAQAEIALAILDGLDVFPVTKAGPRLTSKKIDVLSWTWEPGINDVIRIPYADQLLSPWKVNAGRVRTVRV